MDGRMPEHSRLQLRSGPPCAEFLLPYEQGRFQFPPERGFQWWIPDNASPGEVMAQGIYGQYIYINPGLGVVIAVNSADRGFEEPGVDDGNIAMLRAIAAGLPTP